MGDTVDALRTLDWATTWADACEQRFGARLCGACVAQGRARCALADYARHLIAQRYGIAGSRSSEHVGAAHDPASGPSLE